MFVILTIYVYPQSVFFYFLFQSTFFLHYHVNLIFLLIHMHSFLTLSCIIIFPSVARPLLSFLLHHHLNVSAQLPDPNKLRVARCVPDIPRTNCLNSVPSILIICLYLPWDSFLLWFPLLHYPLFQVIVAVRHVLIFMYQSRFLVRLIGRPQLKPHRKVSAQVCS